MPGPRKAAAEESEYRLVTILFTDVVGSTELGGRLDPETLRLVMDRCLRTMNQAVDEFGGTVARLMGDGLLAFFGAPVAHEDDPERAALAAYRIQEKISSFSQELGQPLKVRVGVNTGRVVMGEMGGEITSEYTATGTPINLAARLESAAEPGQTLVGETTARLIRHRFELEPTEPLALKGFTEPVVAFKLLGRRPVPQSTRGVSGLDSPLIGRESQRDQMSRLLQSLEAGRGGICSLIGEPGIGKSRLLLETRKTASAGPVRWAEGRAYSYTQQQPFSVVIDLMAGLLGLSVDDSPALMDLKLERELSPLFGEEIGDVWPFLAVLMGSPVPQNYTSLVGQLPPAQLNSKISEAVQRTVEAVAEQEPLALAFEDLHWADQGSIALIQSLMLSSERIPLLLVLLFRPERNKPAWNLKLHAETEFAHRYLELVLGPLNEQASQTLVESLLNIPHFPPALRRLIQRKAEGNPFFVEELIHDLIERDVLVRKEGVWEMSGEIETLGVPNKVEEVIMARLDRLSPPERTTLQTASVIGRRFSFRELEMVAAGREDLMEHLLQLQRADMVRESTQIHLHEYIFKHALVQETAYRTLLKEQRKALHRKAGEALELLFPDRVEENAALIGRHYEVAGLVEKAIGYYLRAGRRAAKLASNHEAVSLLNRGLELLKRTPETSERSSRELELQLALGPPLQLVKGFSSPEVERVYDRARVLSRNAHDTPQLFPAIWGLWSYYEFRGDTDFAIDVGEKLVSMAERAQDTTFLLQAHHTLWTTRLFEGSFAATLEHARIGLDIYDAQLHRHQAFMYGSHDPAMCNHGMSAVALWALGYADQALWRSEESLRAAKKLDHPFNTWLTHFFAAWHGHMRRDIEVTRDNAEAMITIATKLSPPFVHLGKLLRSWAQVQLGAAEFGPAHVERSVAEVKKGWRGRFRAYALAILAEAYKSEGRYEEALVALDEALEAAEQATERFYVAEMLRLKGELLQIEGAGDPEVERYYRKAIEVAQSQEAKFFELRAATSLSLLWKEQERHDEARQLMAQLVGWFTEGFDTVDLLEAKALLS